MGYWNTDNSGVSFTGDGEMLWGDSPADALDDALLKIAAAFKEDVGRYPTAGEIRAGLEFSLLGKKDQEVYNPDL